jgi:hypothetical protein
VTIEDYIAEVEGRIHALTTICSVLIAFHPDQAAMRGVLANTRKFVEQSFEPRLAPYNKGMLAVLADLERAAETRTQAELANRLTSTSAH